MPSATFAWTPGTSAQSRANFSSLRANACVFEGKWSYEATLGSSGIMQLGWCTTRCPFTRENGVGDAPDSFAFDGHRVRKWNVAQPYGKALGRGRRHHVHDRLEPGARGGTVSYHRNGVPLGVAFDNVRRWRDVERAADGAAAASARTSRRCRCPWTSASRSTSGTRPHGTPWRGTRLCRLRRTRPRS